MTAEIIVDITHSNVDRIFEYDVPPGMDIHPGSRVLVPFGGGNKTIEGFVVGLRETAKFAGPLKRILRTLEDYPALTEEQLELAFWMRERYGCLLIDALCLMIPAQMRGLRVKEKTVRTVSINLDAEGISLAEASMLSKTGACRAPLQRDVLRLLASADAPISTADLESLIPGGAKALPAMEKKGWIAFGTARVRRDPLAGLKSVKERPRMTVDQANAVDAVDRALENRRMGPLSPERAFLLKGVTGSGKTEVYMRCIERCLALGLTAIVLVPEISLTPQTVARFRGRFGGVIAVLHSRLSAGERFDEWKRIRLGQAKVVVGARSAVFAPVENLGLIVIDEEHESSYNSEKKPRYSACDVAKKRCELTGASLILGSATPSLESYFLAKGGEYTLLNLQNRINGRPMPPVTVVDMRRELEAGNRTIFSDALYSAIRDCLRKGEQAMLLQNRRGYSTFVSCRGCGHVMKCQRCDVSLTYHKNDESLRCHYCGERLRVPPICPECKKPYLKYFGQGTQQVEEAVKKAFPMTRVLRMDRDTTATKGSHLAILNAFANREADILIGTQMIAKGLDFPNVTLVGVVAADATLFMSDYRSAERAFSLITQVAGRAGRDAFDGTAIVQTYSPEHPSIRFAAHHDYEGFYAYEIEKREKCQYPPFSDFVRILFTGPDYPAVKSACEAFAESAKSLLQRELAKHPGGEQSLVYLRAMPAPIGFIKDEYRFQVLIKLLRTPAAERAMALLSVFCREYEAKGSLLALETNPQNML
ncbi:MAG: replication restart helicase PriA [Christensenellales bacterium]|jgi:primosomal protein N' (replication factor Y)